MAYSVRTGVKRLVERVAGTVAATPIGRGPTRDRVLVLAYHNIVPDHQRPAGDRSLHLSQSSFRAQLERLGALVDVVPLTAALSPAPSTRPRAVITFDDAYRGAIELGGTELGRAGFPATVFVVPGRLGAEFWWDRYAPATGSWDAELRARLLVEFAGRDAPVDTWAARNGRQALQLTEWYRSATELELETAARRATIELGSHTWSHPNLAALDGAELREEVVRPLIWLRERFDSVVPWLAYPYGLTSAAAVRAVEAAGYAGGLLIDGGWWPRRPTDRFRLTRWNVPAGISPSGFSLRLSGWLCR